MKLYKLTDENDETYNHTKWGRNVTHTADGKRSTLCSSSWIHAYKDPILALLMNPVHAKFKKPHLWECEGDVGLEEPTKVGCTRLTTLRRIRKPRITKTQRRRFAIFCALEVYELWQEHDKDSYWLKWAKRWLTGKHTTRVAYAADVAAHATDVANTAAIYTTHVAYAVAYAAYAAAYAAYPDESTISASNAASNASNASNINLVKIAREAIT